MSVVTHLIAAARPNFMKIAPLYHALHTTSWCDPVLVHTGQHYDANMSDDFFRDLGLPAPDHHLGVGSGSHAEQTAGVMIGYEALCGEAAPDWIVVAGDVNSTVACALVGAKLHLPVAHLEAGLRSRDRAMPEEINRIVTDSISDLLWTPSADADRNLRSEGVPAAQIERIGNIMIDSYELLRPRITASNTRDRFGLAAGAYGVVTLHRPSNVDDRATLARIVTQLRGVAETMPLVFAVHPRTRARLERFDLARTLDETPGIETTEPLGYIAFMSLVSDARLIITDSGGVQEETTYLDIPCLTLRDTTERPITVTQGTNRLIPPDQLTKAVTRVQDGQWPRATCPPGWDGRAAVRAAASLARRAGVAGAAGDAAGRAGGSRAAGIGDVA